MKLQLVGILLGSGVKNKGSLDRTAISRTKKTLQLFEQQKIRKCILSGGFTNPKAKISEAQAMQNYLLQRGVKKSQLILEERSKDTLGNAIFSKKLIIKHRLPKEIILITSKYHISRALSIFKQIYGKTYHITPMPARHTFLHKVQHLLHELESEGIDELFLTQIKQGDHRKAERLLKKEHFLYRN